MSDKLAIWTVYDHPSDYPNAFVAHLSEVDATGAVSGFAIFSENLDELRAALASQGLIKLTRSQEDDPKIIEVWL